MLQKNIPKFVVKPVKEKKKKKKKDWKISVGQLKYWGWKKILLWNNHLCQ